MNGMLIPIVVLPPVVIAIATAIFQWLWNITMPLVFDLKRIMFWQAFRILLLAWLLFGGSFIKLNMDIGGVTLSSTRALFGG